MRIVEYRLDNGHIPSYIQDGGYFLIGDTLIGIANDIDNIGASTVLSVDDLKARIVSIELTKTVTTPLTNEEKLAFANSWIQEKI